MNTKKSTYNTQQQYASASIIAATVAAFLAAIPPILTILPLSGLTLQSNRQGELNTAKFLIRDGEIVRIGGIAAGKVATVAVLILVLASRYYYDVL